MNPLFSDDPVERVLAMIAVRPPIPLPAWVRTPRPPPPWPPPIIRISREEWDALPRFHVRHEANARLVHDSYILGPARFPGFDPTVPWYLLARVVWRGPKACRVVYRRILRSATLDEIADDIERVREARRRTP